MHYLLENYINAKETNLKECSCPNCFNKVKKKGQSHIFCDTICKDMFWTKIRGRQYGMGRLKHIPSMYPGGYKQWKIDLKREMENIFEQELFKED